MHRTFIMHCSQEHHSIPNVQSLNTSELQIRINALERREKETLRALSPYICAQDKLNPQTTNSAEANALVLNMMHYDFKTERVIVADALRKARKELQSRMT
jgi:hypothetical protein